MLRLSEVDKLVAEEFERSKGPGARKLVATYVCGARPSLSSKHPEL